VTIGGTYPLGPQPASLTVEGRRFLVSNTKEIRVIVTPHLKIAMQKPASRRHGRRGRPRGFVYAAEEEAGRDPGLQGHRQSFPSPRNGRPK